MCGCNCAPLSIWRRRWSIEMRGVTDSATPSHLHRAGSERVSQSREPGNFGAAIAPFRIHSHVGRSHQKDRHQIGALSAR